jgi:hypothetical protein
VSDPNSSSSPTPPDAITSGLADLEVELRDELTGIARVTRQYIADERISVVDIEPDNPDALGVSWFEMGPDLMIQAGHNGGRWELDRSEWDVVFIEQIVRAVLAGRVVETFAPGRSHVVITLADGTAQYQTGYDGCMAALVPLPGWKRFGRSVEYRAYA